jgi:hypothetical protein
MTPLTFDYNELYELFPEMLHFEYNGHMMKTQFGFGDGWYPIIKSALTLMRRNVDAHNERREQAITFHKAFQELRFDDLPSHLQSRAKAGDATCLPSIEEELVMPHFTQIKEKFGGLRMYGCVETTKPYNHGVISMAEELASQTCEVTGNTGVLMIRNRGLYKVINPEYAATEGGWEFARS